MVRAQRILAGIELFALALLSGGLFYLLFIVLPGIKQALPDIASADAKLMSVWYVRVGSLEIILAAAILASNFAKLATFPHTGELQKLAVLVATLMLVVSIVCQVSVRPRLDDLRSDLQTIEKTDSAAETIESARLLEKKHINLLRGNLIFALFLLYCYRVFEEQKIKAIFNVLKQSKE